MQQQQHYSSQPQYASLPNSPDPLFSPPQSAQPLLHSFQQQQQQHSTPYSAIAAPPLNKHYSSSSSYHSSAGITPVLLGHHPHQTQNSGTNGGNYLPPGAGASVAGGQSYGQGYAAGIVNNASNPTSPSTYISDKKTGKHGKDDYFKDPSLKQAYLSPFWHFMGIWVPFAGLLVIIGVLWGCVPPPSRLS